MPMLGTIRAVRGTTVSAMATGALLRDAIGFAERRGWRQVEISWVLDDKPAMRATMTRLPAKTARTWRILARLQPR